MKHRLPPPRTPVLYAIIAVAVIASVVIWQMGRKNGADSSAAAPVALTQSAVPPADPKSPAPASPQSGPATAQSASKTFETFHFRPFAVAKESGLHQWTEEDGRTPDAILEIAHNELEVQRLMEENARIRRRQLVYRKEPVFVAVERARATGELVRTLTLPGLDGQELAVEVTRADVEPSGLKGTFTGRLPGRGASLVTLAFSQGREAFTVISPEDGTFLQGHPREPGEIILTSFDPDTYLSLPGGEPIKTSQ